MSENDALLAALAASLLAIVAGLWFSSAISKMSAGNERMQEIAGAIQEGATAYLNRQYTTIGIVGAVIFFI